MATVSADLLIEGEDVLSTKNAEEIHKFGDRIISVEPDNWYGHYIRGCGYAYEADFGNCVANWEQFLNIVEGDEYVEKFCPAMCQCLAYCLNHLSGKPNLDFGKLGEMLNIINDKLPESDDEFFVTNTMKIGLAEMKNTLPVEPVLTYHSYKALVFCSFRAYVELPLLSGFFDMLISISNEIKMTENPKVGAFLDTDLVFLNEVKAAMDSAVQNCPPEVLEQIEEYWLEHKVDAYVAHIHQAYNASGVAAAGGRFTSKIAKKLVLTEVQTFIKVYLSPKV